MMTATFSSLFERIVVVVLVAMLLIVVWIGLSLREHVSALTTDIQLLRGFLMAFPTPSQCPDPGVKTTKICRYKLKILERIEDPKDPKENYFKAQIDEHVVAKAQGKD